MNEKIKSILGDAYTFVGIEHNTKLVLAWHLGQRDILHTEAFTISLYFSWDNSCRVHSSIRCTPAMEAG